MAPIDMDAASFAAVVVLFLAFFFSYLMDKDKGAGKKEPTLKQDKPDEVPPVAAVVEETIIPEEGLSAVVEPDVTEAEQEAVIEGVAAEPPVVKEVEPLNTVFHGINMALMPDEKEVDQIHWLRAQMGDVQPEDQKRSVPFSTASARMVAYYHFLGEQVARTLLVPVSSVTP